MSDMRAFRGLALSCALGGLVWLALGVAVFAGGGGGGGGGPATPTLAVPTGTPLPVYENWASMDKWTGTAGCATASGGILHTSCGQVFSVQTWPADHALTVQGKVRGQASGPYFCGIAILQDGYTYGQIAVGRRTAPASSWTPEIVFWANEVGGPYRYSQDRLPMDDWQDFVVMYSPGAAWNSAYNGVRMPTIIKPPLTGSMRIDLQGGPPPGGGECQYQAVKLW